MGKASRLKKERRAERFEFLPLGQTTDDAGLAYLRRVVREQQPDIAMEELDRYVADLARLENYVSSMYQVAVDRNPPHGFKGLEVWHLSIKRHDRGAFHDWRELQGIKNAICGPEVEAFELYPAQSRVVDGANQYHLWAFPGGQLPVGFGKGLTSDEMRGRCRQRPGSGDIHAPARGVMELEEQGGAT